MQGQMLGADRFSSPNETETSSLRASSESLVTHRHVAYLNNEPGNGKTLQFL